MLLLEIWLVFVIVGEWYDVEAMWVCEEVISSGIGRFDIWKECFSWLMKFVNGEYSLKGL